VRVADDLRARGEEPTFLAPPDERERWEVEIDGRHPVVVLPDLGEVARFLCESRAVVAMDSGIGHLASAVGTPVLSVFRRRSSARFWRPAFGPVCVVTPPRLLPRLPGPTTWRWTLGAGAVSRALARFLRETQERSAPQRSR
jgi:ADP-heptose:LPS heptosyltransferase